MGAYEELSRRNQELSGEELGPCSTTECMRLAVLYPALERWLEAGALRDVVVLGAGCYGNRSPQVQELCAVLHARQSQTPVELTVVDMDGRVLEAVRSDERYDFEQLTWRSFPEGELKERVAERLRRLDVDRSAGAPRYELRVLRCDLREFDYGESLADLVISTFALMYVLPQEPSPAVSYLARIVRALRPGGRFVVDVNTQVEGPLFFYDAARIDALAARLGELVGGAVTIHGLEAENPELLVFTRSAHGSDALAS